MMKKEENDKLDKELFRQSWDFVNDLVVTQDTKIGTVNISPHQEHINIFSTIISNVLNDFLDGQDLFANATTYNNINRFSTLMMVKISFEEKKKKIFQSEEELKKIEKDILDQAFGEASICLPFLMEKKEINRKKLNYKLGNYIYIIRPNQRRFWTKSIALEDALELIIEILNEN